MAENSDNRAKRNKYRRKKAMLKRAHKKAGIAFCIVSQAITGFYKRSVKQATSSSKMKFVFAITVVMLTIVMTVICHIWFNFGYGPIW